MIELTIQTFEFKSHMERMNFNLFLFRKIDMFQESIVYDIYNAMNDLISFNPNK